MIWTVIIWYPNESEYGSFTMSTNTTDRTPAWRLAQEQIGGSGHVIALVKGRHETVLRGDVHNELR